MKISFVLPIYNRAAWVAQTINTLLKQDEKDVELIVVDDCSTDSINGLRMHYIKNKNVHWFKNEKRMGAAWCRNFGNKKSIGEIIAVCDAGDHYPNYRATTIIEFFEKNKNISLFYSDVQVSQCTGQAIGIQPAEKWNGEGKPPISHPTVAYKREVGLGVKYHEGCVDTDLYEFFLHDVWKKGYRFGFENKTTCVKVDIQGGAGSRDVQKAKDLKFEKYKEYGIEITREVV